MQEKPQPSDLIDALGGTAHAARLSDSAWSTVSGWRLLDSIPDGKLFMLAYPLEVATGGIWSRKKLFPKIWEQVWPELKLTKKRSAK